MIIIAIVSIYIIFLLYVVLRFRSRHKSARFRELQQKQLELKKFRKIARTDKDRSFTRPTSTTIVAKAAQNKKSNWQGAKRQRVRKSVLLAEIEWLERKTAKMLAEQAQELAKQDHDVLTTQEIDNIVEQVIGDELEHQEHGELELTPQEQAEFEELFNDKYEDILNDAEHLEQLKELANLHYQALPEDEVDYADIQTHLPQVEASENTSVSLSADITFTDEYNFKQGTTLSSTKVELDNEQQQEPLTQDKNPSPQEAICLTDAPNSKEKK